VGVGDDNVDMVHSNSLNVSHNDCSNAFNTYKVNLLIRKIFSYGEYVMTI